MWWPGQVKDTPACPLWRLMEAIEWHGCTEQLLMSRKSKLEVEKNVLLQFSKFVMANVLAVDCILETDLFSIWYKKLHMWWNLAQILVRRDGFFGLSWLPVPRIERWSEKIAHVLLCKIWTWKCVLLLFPQEVWNDEYFPLDCISDTGSHGIWYEKLRLWWNRAWILVHMDGSGLSGYRVPRIEHWESNYTCPPVQIWTRKNAYLLPFPNGW